MNPDRPDGSAPARETCLVIGVGNELRGDDAAGLLVARRIRAADLPGVDVIESSDDGAALMNLWKKAKRVILIDTVSSPGAPAPIMRLEANRAPLPAILSGNSTHSFGVAEAVEMSRSLGTLPTRFTVVGIRGTSFGLGSDPSPGVLDAVERVGRDLSRELSGPGDGGAERASGTH